LSSASRVVGDIPRRAPTLPSTTLAATTAITPKMGSASAATNVP
jgi:hypothetical protein